MLEKKEREEKKEKNWIKILSYVGKIPFHCTQWRCHVVEIDKILVSE